MPRLGSLVKVIVFALCAISLFVSMTVLTLIRSDRQRIASWASDRGETVVAVEMPWKDGPFKRKRPLTRIYRVKLSDWIEGYRERGWYWIKFETFELPEAYRNPPICRCQTPNWTRVEAPR